MTSAEDTHIRDVFKLRFKRQRSSFEKKQCVEKYFNGVHNVQFCGFSRKKLYPHGKDINFLWIWLTPPPSRLCNENFPPFYIDTSHFFLNMQAKNIFWKSQIAILNYSEV